MTDTRALTARWIETLRAAGARGDIAAAGIEILAAYADKTRRYHDLTHLTEVLEHVDELAPALAEVDVTAVVVAAFFHDLVHDAATDDEQHSADAATLVLASLGVPTHLVEEVHRLVLLTASHDPAADDLKGMVLCDADLAILAAGPERYATYAAGVREEYAHIDDATFCIGRAQLLRRLVEQKSLFNTEQAQDRWERSARRNVLAELQLLTASAAMPDA